MAEATHSTLVQAECFERADEIARVMGVEMEEMDLSYATALDLQRAQLSAGDGYGMAAMKDLQPEEAQILNTYGWTVACFRADSVTYEDSVVKRFATAHGIDPEEAHEELKNLIGFSADLRIGKPLVTLQPTDTFKQLAPDPQETIRKRLASEYNYGNRQGLSWTPFPTLIAHVHNQEEPIIDLTLCPIGTEPEYHSSDPPAAHEGNKIISAEAVSPDEHIALAGLYQLLADEARVLLSHPERQPA